MMQTTLAPNTSRSRHAAASYFSLFMRQIMRALLVISTLCCMVSLAPAQNVQFTQGSVGSGLDNSIQIPIWTYPGRGTTSFPVTLYYSSRVWRIGNINTVNYQNSYQSIAEAIYAEYSRAGWKTSLDLPVIEWPKSDDTYYWTGKPFCHVCNSNANAFRVARVFIHMPDGSTSELRRSDQPYQGPIDRSGIFYAVDGSRLRFDSTGNSTGNPSTGILYLPDGTRYVLNGNTAQYIDSDGNTLNYSNGQWTDTLNRPITVPLPSSPQAQDYSYTPPGFTSPYTFHFKNLLNALTPDANGNSPQLQVMASHYLPTPSASPNATNNFPQTNQSPSLFSSATTDDVDNPQYTIVVGRDQAQNRLFNPVVLTGITLPNGLSYQFSYNIYGEIDKVTYPTGGYEQEEYTVFPPIGDLKEPYTQANRGIAKRKLSANGTGNDIAEWNYSSTGSVVTTIAPNAQDSTPTGTRTESYRKNYPTPRHVGTQGSLSYYWPFGFEDARQGVVEEERVYAPASQGGAMLRRTLTKWEQTSNPVAPSIPELDNTYKTAYRNPRSVKTVSLILDTGGSALAKTITSQYNTGFELTTGIDPTVLTESSFDSVLLQTAQTGTIDAISPNSGTLASITETTYIDDALHPEYRNRNILGLVTAVVLKAANGQVISKTEKFYDETSYPLMTYGDLTENYIDPGLTTVRGNVTTMRRYLDPTTTVAEGQPCPTGVCLETHAQFDQCGNLRKEWNERGFETQTEFPSEYKHAYAKQATTEVPDPFGTHGSNQPFTSSSTFDLTTGLRLSTIDANGQTTTFSYMDQQGNPDPLNRLRKVTRPDNGWTTYDFHDVVGDFYTLTKVKQDATHITEARQYYDKLGRANRSLILESETNYLATDTKYDQLGRVCTASNPYRTQSLSGTVTAANDCTAASNWTTSEYDALGRVWRVTLPDMTIAQTFYQGIYTTITDQAGKQRRQMVDALGRIVRVDEPDTSGNMGTVDNPTQPTAYTYDTLGNVIQITQGTGATIQERFFKYDALSRLIYEKQVEQSVVFPTENPQWSRKLVYDETINGVTYKGLLTSQTDARQVRTEYQYDQLSRIYRITYSGVPMATVDNYYDQARSGYFNKGQLTQVTTTAVAASAPLPAIPATSQSYDFDSMGKVRRHQQQIDWNPNTQLYNHNYTLSYEYDLGGQLTSETYPSGRVVSYGYDGAARLSSVGSGGTTYASQFVYGTKGQLGSVTLGNGAVESYDYNDRLQVKEQSLVKDGATIQRYQYKYGRVQADGTVDETKNNGQLGRIESFIGTAKQWQQRFEYDSLGRLSAASEYRGDTSQRSYLIQYDYDRFGNRYQKAINNPTSTNPLSYTPVEDADISQSTNRFTTGIGITYDAAGNITQDTKFRSLQFKYDANNRQQWSANLDGSNPVTAVYDGAGQRVALLTNGVLSLNVYDAFGKLVAEYGQPASTGTGGTQYVFADQQGTPRVVTTQSGSVLTRHDYEPFGAELPATLGLRATTPGYSQADGIKQKYAGMEADEGGLSHTLWRQYDTRSGRWTAPDPYNGSMEINSPQTLNRYNYVNNDPVNKIDPTGLMMAIGGVGGGCVGGDGSDYFSRWMRESILEMAVSRNYFAATLRSGHGQKTRRVKGSGSGGKGKGKSATKGKKEPTPLPDGLKVLSVVAMSPNEAGNTCKADYGGQVKITYQARLGDKDLTGNDMVPLESISLEMEPLVPLSPQHAAELKKFINDFNAEKSVISEIGGENNKMIPGVAPTTNSRGQFVDAPVGICARFPFKATLTQQLYMRRDGQTGPVGSTKLNINSSTKGSDSADMRFRYFPRPQ